MFLILDQPLRLKLAQEITDTLRGAIVRRIFQPAPNLLLLRLFLEGDQKRLMVSGDPRNARVQLTERKIPNPKTPSPFCMLARKHLIGLRFERASSDPGLPVITLIFAPPRGSDANNRITLAVELTGHASTVLLLSESEGHKKVLGSLRKLPGARRNLSPGALYATPSLPGRLDPLTATPETLRATVARLARGGTEKVDRLLSRACVSVGRRLASEARTRAGLVSELVSGEISETDASAFLSELRVLIQAPCQPQIVLDANGEAVEILPFPLTSLDLPAEPVGTVSEALDQVCVKQEAVSQAETRRTRLLRAITRQITHREEKIPKQKASLEEARGGDRYRRMGDLLLAQGNVARRRLSELEVLDIFDPAQPAVTIPLDPRLTVAQNAERFYKRAKKAQRAVGSLSTVIARGEAELRFLAEQRLHCQHATDPSTLDSIEESLRETVGDMQGKWRESARHTAIVAARLPAGPRKYVINGWEVLAGRHARDNDRIVTHWGAPDDLWLHARNVAGAHVLLRRRGREEPPAAVVEGAARIAAFFSQARDERHVDVIVARVRHLRKRRGLLPGQVEVLRSETLRVSGGVSPESLRSAKGKPSAD